MHFALLEKHVAIVIITFYKSAHIENEEHNYKATGSNH